MASATPPATPAWRASGGAVHAFARAGFSCSPAPARQPLICFGRLSSYPDDVALIVPPGHSTTRNAEWILYLHGFGAPRLPELVESFALAQGLTTSGRNEILVIPRSSHREDEFLASLVPRSALGAFFEELNRLSREAGLSQSAETGKVVLAAHSGGYLPVARILEADLLPVEEVYLFDGLYGQLPSYRKFIATPGHRFWASVGPTTRDISQNLMGELTKQGIPIARVSGTPDSAALGNRVGFVSQDVDHFQSVNKYLAPFLSEVR